MEALGESALAAGGRGAGLRDDVRLAGGGAQAAQTPQNVYDAATWSAIFPLSIDSVAKGSQPVEFPDFTKGRWGA